jgi:hypothetical protein
LVLLRQRRCEMMGLWLQVILSLSEGTVSFCIILTTSYMLERVVLITPSLRGLREREPPYSLSWICFFRPDSYVLSLTHYECQPQFSFHTLFQFSLGNMVVPVAYSKILGLNTACVLISG